MSPEGDRAQREASRKWERTPGSSERVICPFCGKTGLPAQRWVLGHTKEAHAKCGVCGKTKTKRGMAVHKAKAHPSTLP